MSANRADLLRRRILSRLRFRPRRRSSSRRRRTGPGRCNASLNTTPFRPGGSSGFQRRTGATAGIPEIDRRLEHHHGSRSSTSSRSPGNSRRCKCSTHYHWNRSPRSHSRTRQRRVPRPPRPPRTRPPSRAPLIPRGTGSTPDIHRCSPRDRRSRQTSTSSRRLRAYRTCTNSTRDRTRRRPQRRPQSHSPRILRQRVPRTRRPHDIPLPSRARTCPRGKPPRRAARRLPAPRAPAPRPGRFLWPSCALPCLLPCRAAARGSRAPVRPRNLLSRSAAVKSGRRRADPRRAAQYRSGKARTSPTHPSGGISRGAREGRRARHGNNYHEPLKRREEARRPRTSTWRCRPRP